MLKVKQEKKKRRKDLKITSFATTLKPYGTIILLPTIHYMCVWWAALEPQSKAYVVTQEQDNMWRLHHKKLWQKIALRG